MTTRDVVECEKLGIPVAWLVITPFLPHAENTVEALGMSNLPVVEVPASSLEGAEITESKLQELAEEVIDDIVRVLTTPVKEQRLETEVKTEMIPVFRGKNYADTIDNMEKYFLNHRMSDGFPLIPPTSERVKNMLEGSDLPPDHVVGIVAPGNGVATVEKIAINAAMAGCLPQYMPVIIAAVEAITDSLFDLPSVQTTAGGQVSPLLIISGWQLIKDLNINYSFSTLGPGWRANSTIGRAVRLIMINLGRAWPGESDMKPLGMPHKYVTALGENEPEYQGVWEPLRTAEGFRDDQAVVSVMPAQSFVTFNNWCLPYIDAAATALKHTQCVPGTICAYIWGEEVLVLMPPVGFDDIRTKGWSRSEVQKMIYEKARVTVEEFGGKENIDRYKEHSGIPQWIQELPPNGFVPIVPEPKDIKIVVAGGRSHQIGICVTNPGSAAAHWVTKPVRIPKNWNNLLGKYTGWDTPIQQ